MRHCRRRPDLPRYLRRSLVVCCILGLVVLQSTSYARSPIVASVVCDPPGPAPRFGCQWSTDVCDWICAICDPFGTPPRSSCHWDGTACNWICPGYTGVDVTVQTTQPPVRDATVYVRLSSLCGATGSFAGCNGSFAVYPGMLIAQKCQEIANVISNDCSSAGYAVTANTCRIDGSFTASNVGCPPTQFALGLSNSPSVFDQAGLGPLPDGESDDTTGTTGACTPMPGAASNLRLTTANGDQDLLLTWDDATNAEAYLIFSDTAPNGTFGTVAGSAQDGPSGSMLGMPPGIEFYLVAGRNSTCGVGPKN